MSHKELTHQDFADRVREKLMAKSADLVVTFNRHNFSLTIELEHGEELVLFLEKFHARALLDPDGIDKIIEQAVAMPPLLGGRRASAAEDRDRWLPVLRRRMLTADQLGIPRVTSGPESEEPPSKQIPAEWMWSPGVYEYVGSCHEDHSMVMVSLDTPDAARAVAHQNLLKKGHCITRDADGNLILEPAEGDDLTEAASLLLKPGVIGELYAAKPHGLVVMPDRDIVVVCDGENSSMVRAFAGANLDMASGLYGKPAVLSHAPLTPAIFRLTPDKLVPISGGRFGDVATSLLVRKCWTAARMHHYSDQRDAGVEPFSCHPDRHFPGTVSLWKEESSNVLLPDVDVVLLQSKTSGQLQGAPLRRLRALGLVREAPALAPDLPVWAATRFPTDAEREALEADLREVASDGPVQDAMRDYSFISPNLS